MKIEKILHAHVIVKDLDQAVRRFSDLMGTKFVGPFPGKSPIKTAFDEIGIELMQPLPETESYIANFLKERGEGVAGISLQVENIEEAISELESKGVTFVMKGSLDNVKIAVTDPKDCHGVGIELLEFQRMQEAPYVVSGKVAELPWM
jgi:catechol 2,3-dioxygenase-like lactoylglutathione lyase family enzyme